MPTLGNRLTTTLNELTDLIVRETDSARKKELRVLFHKVANKLQKLIDNNIRQDTEKYATATDGLKEANTALRKANKDIAKVAEAIEKVAQAIRALTKLAGALA